MKTIIVDDSKLARHELIRLLEPFSSVNICGEAGNVDEAHGLFLKEKPQLVFLDIDMPGKNGFEFLQLVEEKPLIIFTTAHDNYALKAFEEEAVDYLLKPIDPERLEKAVGKAFLLCEEFIDYKESMTPEDRVFVSDRDKCWFVQLKNVRFFETYGNYSKVYFDGKSVLVNKSLNYLESRLSKDSFFRVSRQYIINLHHVKDIHPWNNESYRVVMSCGAEIDISRRKSQQFKEMMSF